jgi:hypothetical protein
MQTVMVNCFVNRLRNPVALKVDDQSAVFRALKVAFWDILAE